MKELSIEEKAKAYDEAREKIAVRFGTNVAEEIFSEFEESEDERIRKGLINYFNHHKNGINIFYGIKGDDILAWLEKQGEVESDNDDIEVEEKGIREAFNKIEDEKQGEQKPADKVEPKFNIGDWVVYYRNDSSREVLQVYDIRDGRYYFTDNVHFSWSVKECDEKSHLWTISDAKDGDILVYRDGQWIFIYKEKVDDNSFYYHTLYSTIHQDLTINDSAFTLLGDAIIPATKEQRDFLFKKMKEAGYEWDAEKRELKKISQRMISAEAKEAMYAKTAWSEDDEKMLVDAYVMLDWYKGNNWWTARRIKDWLNSLKERIGG